MRGLVFIDLPSYEKNAYKRIPLKINEFNQSVCTENNETVREEKWQNWVKQEEQLLYGTYNITFVDHTEYKKKVGFEKFQFLIKISSILTITL